MSNERLARHWSTTKAYDALQRLIEGKHRLHIPVQESDEDRIIAAVIDERDALLAALDAATARYTDLFDAFHEEQRLRNRRVDW